MQTKDFHYKKAFKIGYRGCCFHSLLELKFALSIEDEYSFLREHIQIWYEPKTLLPTNYLKETTKRYTPDFLMRNKINNKAYLVELKPRAFETCTTVRLYKQVAENYILHHQYDWQFKIIYDDEITLTQCQKQKFEELRNTVPSFAGKLKMQDIDKRYNSNKINYFRTIPSRRGENMTSNEYARCVKYGCNV